MNSLAFPLRAKAPPSGDEVCRVIVADDSLVIRRFIARLFENDAGFKVVATASNGQMAVNALRDEPADVVILDIEMPVMDGLAAIPRLKAIDPAVQIVMASTLTQRNADISLRALSLGATDYVPKPVSERDLGADNFGRELVEKARVLGAVARRRGVRRAKDAAAAPPPVPEPKRKIALRSAPIARPAIIAIGSSTGGPQALFEMVRKMGKELAQPVVITQHMPPAFTAILAEHIMRQCGVACSEAVDGEYLQVRHYYVAPGDYHMLIDRTPQGPVIRLTKDPPENFCRPAVDPMLRSLAQSYGRKVMAVILTGMGQDGLKGCETLVDAGGAVLAQDEPSSVVWGMPGAVAMAGLCSAVLPIGELGSFVQRQAMGAGA